MQLEIPFRVASPLSLDTFVKSDKDLEDERSPLAANGGPAHPVFPVFPVLTDRTRGRQDKGAGFASAALRLRMTKRRRICAVSY
jgi:hypothetical protein